MSSAASQTIPGLTPGEVRRWSSSFITIAALHAAIGGAALFWKATFPVEPPPPAAIMIDLAPLPVAPPAPMLEDALPAPPVETPEVPQELLPPPPDLTAPEPVPEPEPEPVREPEPPEPPPVVEPDVVLPRPTPPRPKPPPPKPRVAPSPRPVPKAEDAPKPTPPPAPSAPAAPAAPAPTPAAPMTSAARAPQTNSLMANFQHRVHTHLARHKRYPNAAQVRRQEGIAQLRFKMNRAGEVLAYRIERSSGVAALDDAVLAMVRRAQPLPRIPPELAEEEIEFVVSVPFSLR